MFGEKLKKLRAVKNLSQQNLAEISGINKMLISKYETGKSMPNMENLGRLAKALGVTADCMIFDNVPDTGRIEYKDIELMEKIQAAEDLSAEDRKVIKTLIDAMIVKRKVEGVVKEHPQ